MANIMINDVCNLQCPYCFANKYVNGDTTTDITYANFKKAVDWINREGAERIAFIGGEPTLHAQFEDLIKYAASQRRPEQEIMVFTNGLFDEDKIDLFKKYHIGMLINLNSYEDIGRKKYNKVVENIKKMRLKGMHASIGINFYKGDLDTKFVLDVIREFGYEELRVGITSPNTSEKIARGPFAYYEEIKKPLFKLIEDCAKLGCGVHFDCQRIPICIMKDKIDYIRGLEDKYGVRIDVFDCSNCTPVLDITTDLQVARCFGVSGNDITVPMEAFANERDLWGYFATNVDAIGRLIPMDEKCMDCYDRNIGLCQGGCLTFKLDKILKTVKVGKTKEFKEA